MNTYPGSRELVTQPFQPARKSNFILARAVALAIATSGVAGVSFAQQAEPAKAPMSAAEAAEKEAADKAKTSKSGAIETVVVTGIRRGIEAAISVKKNSDSIVEAVSAEDIGKLPDTSIAESIARLPGLAAQRIAGRAQVISVRGLSPDFATTLLNGREQVSTGDNRGVEFDQYPSELLSGVTVYKTPDAGLVGQGLSGTLDMQTVRPLSFAKRTMAFNARGERNSLGSGVDYGATGNRFSATYIDQFANRTVGVALGYARLDSPILANEFGGYDWSKDGRPGLAAGTSNNNGLKTYARSGNNQRDGIIGVLEFKPNDRWSSAIDGYYSKFNKVETARGIEANIGNYPSGMNYTATTIANGMLVGGTATGIYPLVRGLYNERKDTLSALAANSKYRFDNFTLSGDASFSRATRNELNIETQGQYVSAAGKPVLDTVTYSFAGDGFPTTRYGLDYTDPSRIKIGDSIYGAGYGKVPKIKDELSSFKLAAAIPLSAYISALSELNVGVNFADRTKTKNQPEAGLTAPSQVVLPADVLYGNTNLAFGGAPSTIAWNVPAVFTRYYNAFVPTENASYLVGKSWSVNEKITTAYAKAGIDTTLGGADLRGNFGVQIQRTEQSSSANYWDNTAAAGKQVKPVTDGKSYTDVLPSLNLAMSFAGQQTLRFAAAEQIARPRLDQLKSAFEFNVDTTTFKPNGNGGNAKLDPWRATAFDISYEKYFAEKGYIALAGFHKKLKTYIYEQSTDYDFSRFTPGTTATSNTGRFKQPLNGKGGSLSGMELSVSVPFSIVTPMLDGFGVVASITNNSSAITIDGTNLGNKIPLPGLSKRVTNLSVYYEKYGFSTRVSQRQRSDFIGEISAIGADRALRYVKGERVVDFQIGYEMGAGAFKGLSFLLQVNNLNNSVFQTYQGTPDQRVEYQQYGRTVLFGVNYKL